MFERGVRSAVDGEDRGLLERRGVEGLCLVTGVVGDSHHRLALEEVVEVGVASLVFDPEGAGCDRIAVVGDQVDLLEGGAGRVEEIVDEPGEMFLDRQRFLLGGHRGVVADRVVDVIEVRDPGVLDAQDPLELYPRDDSPVSGDDAGGAVWAAECDSEGDVVGVHEARNDTTIM